MRKQKFKNSHAQYQDAISPIASSGSLETMKKLIKMYINSTAHLKIAQKNTIRDPIWKSI